MLGPFLADPLPRSLQRYQPFPPVTRLAVLMANRKDQQLIGQWSVDHQIGEAGHEALARSLAAGWPCSRHRGDEAHQLPKFLLEGGAQFWRNGCVVLGRIGNLSLGDRQVADSHRPAGSPKTSSSLTAVNSPRL